MDIGIDNLKAACNYGQLFLYCVKKQMSPTSKFDFGRHKGKTWGSVAEEDPQFIITMIKAFKLMIPKSAVDKALSNKVN